MSIREEFEAWLETESGYAYKWMTPVEKEACLKAYQAATSRQEAKIKALEQAIAQEQSKTIRNCITCKYSHEPANSAVCTDCKHAYTSADHWEPKP